MSSDNKELEFKSLQPEPEVDLDAEIQDMPVLSQFDESGNVNVAAEKEAEEIRKVKALTNEELLQIRSTHPSLYDSYMKMRKRVSKEDDVPLTAKAEYQRHPLRGRTTFFPEESFVTPLPSLTRGALVEEASDAIQLREIDERFKNLINTHDEAMEFNTNNDFGMRALNREGSQWTQAVPTPSGRYLHGMLHKFSTHENRRLQGAEAISYAASMSGAGRPSMFPMFSSGWSVYFRPATNMSWCQYYEKATNFKTSIGRSSFGIGIGVSRSAFIEQALGFALDHLSGVSFKSPAGMSSRQDQFKYMSVHDIDLFLTAFLVACHPDGYPIQLPCSNLKACDHVMELEANLRTMTIYDKSVFTEQQLGHMTRTGVGEMDFESVLSYQAGLRTNQPRIVTIGKTNIGEGEDIKVEFQNVSVQDYLDSSRRYLAKIEAQVKSLIDDKTPEGRREKIYNDFYNMEPMREYAHFVKRIYIGTNVIEEDESNKENPRADIEEYLSRASESETLRTNFLREARKYQEDSMTSIVAVPSFKCPSCGHNNDLTPNNRFLNCIPLDIPLVFISRARLRVAQLTTR